MSKFNLFRRKKLSFRDKFGVWTARIAIVLFTICAFWNIIGYAIKHKDKLGEEEHLRGMGGRLLTFLVGGAVFYFAVRYIPKIGFNPMFALVACLVDIAIVFTVIGSLIAANVVQQSSNDI